METKAKPGRDSKYLDVILGHFCGDAAGATLEFYRGDITDEVVEEAMKMRGGGRLNMGPGQITDDGELTMALFKTLWYLPHKSFPINEIAKEYIAWYHSDPFDCGMTCARAFGGVSAKDYNPGLAMMHNALNVNIVSEANGALMRAAPIACWGERHKHSLFQIANNAKLDAMLSHPSQVCQDANAIYCMMLARLIAHGGNNSQKAVSDVEDHLQGGHSVFHPKVLEWYNEAKSLKTLKEYQANTNIGHVKYAFTMAMFFAHQGKRYTYAQGIHAVLKCGGDTDTNAAICGAVLAAIHDVEGIPMYMLCPVLSFDCVHYDTSKHLLGHNRPKKYHVGDFANDIYSNTDINPIAKN